MRAHFPDGKKPVGFGRVVEPDVSQIDKPAGVVQDVFTPTQDGSGDFEIIVNVDDDFVMSAPLSVQDSVVTEMIRRAEAEGGHA